MLDNSASPFRVFYIGMGVVGIGTSAPEMVVSEAVELIKISCSWFGPYAAPSWRGMAENSCQSPSCPN